jgi:hypothetical protein
MKGAFQFEGVEEGRWGSKLLKHSSLCSLRVEAKPFRGLHTKGTERRKLLKGFTEIIDIPLGDPCHA